MTVLTSQNGLNDQQLYTLHNQPLLPSIGHNKENNKGYIPLSCMKHQCSE